MAVRRRRGDGVEIKGVDVDVCVVVNEFVVRGDGILRIFV